MIKKAGFTIAIAVVICLFLETAVFSRFAVPGITPDMIMALTVTIGIMTGYLRSQIICGALGLLYDIYVCKVVGINCAVYVAAGLISGMFFRKFYTDNVIFPAILAAILVFIKENINAIITGISGISYNYALALIAFIIPKAVLTAIVTIPIYAVMKPMLADYSKYISDKRSNLI